MLLPINMLRTAYANYSYDFGGFYTDLVLILRGCKIATMHTSVGFNYIIQFQFRSKFTYFYQNFYNLVPLKMVTLLHSQAIVEPELRYIEYVQNIYTIFIT